MLFLLRCVLWLSLVYAAILFPSGIRFDVTASPGPQARLAEAATSTVAATVKTYCNGRSAQCLDDAARLTSLISAAGGPPRVEAPTSRGERRP